jgi:hypothetical protein
MACRSSNLSLFALPRLGLQGFGNYVMVKDSIALIPYDP